MLDAGVGILQIGLLCVVVFEGMLLLSNGQLSSSNHIGFIYSPSTSYFPLFHPTFLSLSIPPQTFVQMLSTFD